MRVVTCFIITRILGLLSAFVISDANSVLRKVKADDELNKASRRSPRKPQSSKNTGLCEIKEYDKLVIYLCCPVFVGLLNFCSLLSTF